MLVVRLRCIQTAGDVAEERHRGHEFQDVNRCAHEVCERHACALAFENRRRSREQPATQDWIAQVRDRLCAVADSIQLGSFGRSKARELRKDVPDPVASLAARPEFSEGRRKPGVRLILRPCEALKV